MHAGDLQVIQSGKGIQHAERLLPGSEIFQIWFDPDLQKSLQKDAVYQDYKSAAFPNEIHIGYEVQHIKENDAPVALDAKDVFIRLYSYQKGSFSFLVRDEAMCALFVLDGELKIAGQECRKGDYILVESTDLVDLEIYADTRLFAIELPVDPGYPLYSKSFKIPS